MRSLISSAAAALVVAGSVTVGAAGSSVAQAPGVFTLQNGKPDRIASILRTLYPGARIVADRSSNSIVAFASPSQIAQMRGIVQQLDVKNPTQSLTTAIALKALSSAVLIPKLRVLFPNARFSAGPSKTLLVDATPADLMQIKDVVAAVDVPPPPGPVVARMTDAVKLEQSQPADVVRLVAARIPASHPSAAGGMVLLSGPSDAVAEAKALVLKIDQPAETTPLTQIYRLRSVDAQSVANLLQRNFPTIKVDVEKQLNALTVFAPQAVQTRIAAGILQLDGGAHVAGSQPPVAQPGEGRAVDAGDGQAVEVTNLRAATPALGTTGGSTTAQDIANAVQAALGRSAPGLHITVQPNSTQLILTGTPDEIRLGKELVDQLDVQQKLVVLDTEILEVDESAAKNLGLQIQTPTGGTVPSISTTISENVPTPQPGFSSPPQFLGLLPFTRTGLSIGLQLGLLVSRGDARILADPRITTISGRTATIRAGDNITVQTQAGGGAGTVATTQLQTFQTGVSLDITPVIDAGNFVSILLHPVVNNLSGFSNGIPQISTRDTQTTVGMQADQTLIIGGLIEDSTTNTVTKIPFLGDLPVIGGAFRNRQYSRQRNELVISVTPHIIVPGQAPPASTLGVSGLPVIPAPQALPTLPPGTLLPPPHPLGFVTSRPFVSASQPLLGARPVAAPSGAPGSPRPGPTPSAFGQANTYTYGSAPQNTFALPGDPPKVYFVTLSPTIMKNNATFNISAITTTNVTTLQLQTNSGATMLAHAGGAGFWQASILFTAGNIPPDSNQLNFLLIASKDDGTTQRMNIPVSYSP